MKKVLAYIVLAILLGGPILVMLFDMIMNVGLLMTIGIIVVSSVILVLFLLVIGWALTQIM